MGNDEGCKCKQECGTLLKKVKDIVPESYYIRKKECEIFVFGIQPIDGVNVQKENDLEKLREWLARNRATSTGWGLVNIIFDNLAGRGVV